MLSCQPVKVKEKLFKDDFTKNIQNIYETVVVTNIRQTTYPHIKFSSLVNIELIVMLNMELSKSANMRCKQLLNMKLNQMLHVKYSPYQNIGLIYTINTSKILY